MVTADLALQALTVVWRHFFLLTDQRGLDFILFSPVHIQVCDDSSASSEHPQEVPQGNHCTSDSQIEDEEAVRHCGLKYRIRWQPVHSSSNQGGRGSSTTMTRQDWIRSCRDMYRPLLTTLLPRLHLLEDDHDHQDAMLILHTCAVLLDKELQLVDNQLFAFADANLIQRVHLLHLYTIYISQWMLLLLTSWEEMIEQYEHYRNVLMRSFETKRQAVEGHELGVLVYQLTCLFDLDQHFHQIHHISIELQRYIQLFQYETSHRWYATFGMLMVSGEEIQSVHQHRQASVDMYMEYLTNWNNGLVAIYYSFASNTKAKEEILQYVDVVMVLLEGSVQYPIIQDQSSYLSRSRGLQGTLLNRIAVSRSVLTAWSTNLYLAITTANVDPNHSKVGGLCWEYAYLREALVVIQYQVEMSRAIQMHALTRALTLIFDELLQQEEFYQQHDFHNILKLIETYRDDVFVHDIESMKWWKCLQYSKHAVRFRLEYVQSMWDKSSIDPVEEDTSFWLSKDASDYCHHLASCYSTMAEYLPQDESLTNRALYCMYHSLRYARLAWLDYQSSKDSRDKYISAWLLSASCYLAISKTMLMMGELDVQCHSLPTATRPVKGFASTVEDETEKEDLELYLSQLQELVGLQLENVFQSHELLEASFAHDRKAKVGWLELSMQLASLIFRRIQLLFQAMNQMQRTFQSQIFKLHCWLEDAKEFQEQIESWDKTKENTKQRQQWHGIDSFLLLLDMYVVEEESRCT